MGLRKWALKWLFKDTPPAVVEKQTEVHHHHNHYYESGEKKPRQSGSNLKAAKDLQGVWT